MMDMKSGNRSSPSRRHRLEAVIVLLALCFQMIFIPAAAAETADYNGMTLVEVKQARVYRGTLDSVYTLSTWEFKEQEDVPYVSLKEYQQLVDTYTDSAAGFSIGETAFANEAIRVWCSGKGR